MTADSQSGPARTSGSPVADATAREFLRQAGPTLRELIDARPEFREVLAADPQQVRASGMSTRKGATLRALAERFIDGRLSDESLARMSDDEIEATLTGVPGVGPWTAHGFLIVALDRPDVMLPGDLALRRAVQHAYQLDHLPRAQEMLRIAEPWRPYRSLAVSYLFAYELERSVT